MTIKNLYKTIPTLLTILCLLAATGCDDSTGSTNDGETTFTVKSKTHADELGLYPNDIQCKGKTCYVVESGSNRVSAIKFSSTQPPTIESNEVFIDTGADTSPSAIAIADAKIDGKDTTLFAVAMSGAFGTNQGHLLLEDHDANGTPHALLAKISSEALKDASDIAIHGEYIFVVTSEYSKSAASPGSPHGALLVFRHAAMQKMSGYELMLQQVNRIATTCNNAQFIAQHGDNIYVSATGDTDFATNTPAEGCVDQFALSTIATATAATQSYSFSPRKKVGTPGSMHVFGDHLVIGSTTSPSLFTVDLKTAEITHGTDNPIALPGCDGDVPCLTIPVSIGHDPKYAAAFNFNEDAISIIDLATATVIDGATYAAGDKFEDPQMPLSGPIAGALDADGNLIVLLTNAKKLRAMTFETP